MTVTLTRGVPALVETEATADTEDTAAEYTRAATVAEARDAAFEVQRGVPIGVTTATALE